MVLQSSSAGGERWATTNGPYRELLRVLAQEACAASNCSRTELLIRPRAGTSIPFALAQARIVALSELTLVVLLPPLLRLARPPTLRPWSA